MKKTQWQFTHRPDNQADIKRILREAREDGLTLVEVKGGPKDRRGVYIDAQFIEKHKQHWPKPPDENAITLDDVLPGGSDLDGWAGNWIMFAVAAKRAHEQFCKNLEAASKPREYPPTVSVRAAGPEPSGKTFQFDVRPGTFIPPSPAPQPAVAHDPTAPTWLPDPGEWFTVGPRRLPQHPHANWIEGRDSLLIGKTLQCRHLTGHGLHFDPPVAGYIDYLDLRDFAYLTPAAQWLPTPGEWFKVSGYRPEHSVFHDQPRPQEHERKNDGKTFQCKWVDKPGECDVSARTIERYGNCIATVAGPILRSKEWSKIEPAQDPALQQEHLQRQGDWDVDRTEQYIPKPGDRFTAEAKDSNDQIALSDVQSAPHRQIFHCVYADSVNNRTGVHREHSGKPLGVQFAITTSAYNFRKVEAPAAERYIPKPGDWFTAKAINSGALSHIANDPHGQTLICVEDRPEELRIRFYGAPYGEIWTITKAFYEFRQREKL